MLSEEYYKILGPIKVKKMKLFKHLANLSSFLNSVLGLIAVYYLISMPGEHRILVTKIVIFAEILDALDGRFSRMSTEPNPIGRVLDSISDGVTSGLVPFLAAFSLMGSIPRAFAYLGSGFLLFSAFYRLIRFTRAPTKSLFYGVPVTLPAVLFISAYAMAWPNGWWLFVLCLVSGSLMISTLPYPSLKGNRDPIEQTAFLIGSAGLALYVLVPPPFFNIFPVIFFWYVIFYYTYGLLHALYFKKRFFPKYWKEE